MTIKNDNMHLSGNFAVYKSSSNYLLLSALLFFSTTNAYAQEESKKEGWSLNSNATSSRDAIDKTTTEQPVDTLAATPEDQAQLEEVTQEVLLIEQEKVIEQEVKLVVAADETQEPAERVAPQAPVKSKSVEIIAQPNDVQSALQEYDISEGAGPIDLPPINVRPVVSLTPELRKSLELQFQEIQTLKETEDAYSEQLGESYLSYGRGLMQAGRIDESRKMLVNAQHIAKINNGVNSIEQRPILRELFEMNLALGNVEETEDHLGRIIWLEKKDPSNRDLYSFDMVARLGNHYLDLYLDNQNLSELSLSYLNSSIRWLSYAINRYGDRPLSEVLLPYGELALAYHMRGRISNEAGRSFPQTQNQRQFRDQVSSVSFFSGNSFARSENYLKHYLRKSKEERDLINTVRALLALGDLNILSDRVNSASRYYGLAWTGAQNLPVTHPLAESFNAPVKLPSFNFSVVRQPRESDREVELVPLSINVDDDGRVRKVGRESLSEASVSSTNRARRIVKRSRFRPIIENGKLISVKDYHYNVEVTSRRSKPKPVAAKDSAE